MNLLAFDTSTERLTIAVQRGAERWTCAEAGGRHASSALIPRALALLQQADLKLSALDAIVFGRGPGSFTGLRTACSVAQGLALGAGLRVLPVDTLLAVAEDARAAHGCTQVLALLDARMDQVYAAAWRWHAETGWSGEPARVCAPEALGDVPLAAGAGPWTVAGNAFAAYGARFPAAVRALPQCEAWPRAEALLRVAPGLLAAGGAVAPEEALPVYVRDKVARTVAERRAEQA